MNFLDTVLYLHDKPNIQKFCLSWDEHFDESRVTKWIGVVIRRKVEELSLSAGSRTSFVFPLSFFTCDSLTVLDLDTPSLNVPNMVSLPRLKLLRLTCIDFVYEFSLNKLLSNCPILEELELALCRSSKSKVLCIANTALKNLAICTTDGFRNSTLKISAPNLSTITYEFKEPADFIIDSFPLLVKAYINMPFPSRASVLIKLLEKLSNVKLFKMSGACFQVPSEAEILLLPAYNNLVHLEVRAGFCPPTYSGSDSVSTVSRFFKFLQLSPNLESIVFAESAQFHEEEVDDGFWSHDPNCLPAHLKSIKLESFGGEPAELNAVKLFLKYFLFLETVTIVASPHLSDDQAEQIKVTKLLLMFPRPATCVVKFLTSSDEV